ncbi:MAG: phosphoethanolamine--lipid A transferase [Moraxella sp.]|nr:phosphoethanolamine--lipid A transferase [Moraxella sp.]
MTPRQIFRAVFSRHQLSYSQLIVISAVYFTGVLNLPFLLKVFDLYQHSSSAGIYIYTVPILLLALLALVFCVLIVPFLHKALMSFLILASSAVSYNTWLYNVYFNRDMLDNVLQTTPAESVRMLSVSFMLWLLFTGVLPTLWYCRLKMTHGVWYKELIKRLMTMGVSLAVIAGIAGLFYQDYASFFRNNLSIKHQIVPYNYLNAIKGKIKEQRRKNIPYQALGTGATLDKKDVTRSIVVLVVGETTRNQNWGLSGYERDTTPKLKTRLQQGEHLLNFTNASSCGTSTAHSVPCMFSSMAQQDYDAVYATRQDNLMDVFKHAGHAINWVENNSDCKGVCQNVPNVNVTELNLPEFCHHGHCLDNIMLPKIDEIIKSSDQDVVLVLHTLGNHGPTYYERYTDNERVFTPTCDTQEINNCNKEQLINTYDNGVLYVDQFLDKVIGELQKYPEYKTAVFYASDHGESLGENGFYLHGTPLAIAPKEQTAIPMLIWVSDTWAKARQADIACLKTTIANAYSHDHFFHTALALSDIDLTTVKQYDKTLDILAQCTAQR